MRAGAQSLRTQVLAVGRFSPFFTVDRARQEVPLGDNDRLGSTYCGPMKFS
jgi:hypothetical protein